LKKSGVGKICLLEISGAGKLLESYKKTNSGSGKI
jgi:hypothetical protein